MAICFYVTCKILGNAVPSCKSFMMEGEDFWHFLSLLFIILLEKVCELLPLSSLCIKLSRSPASGTPWLSVWHGVPHLAVQHYSQKDSGRQDVLRRPIGRACSSVC